MQSNDLKGLIEEALPAIAAANAASLEELRVSLLGKNGNVTMLLKSLSGMDPETRKTAGAAINHIKTQISDAISTRRAMLDMQALEQKLTTERIDVTQPPRPDCIGAIHPLCRTQEELAAIFGAMGFAIKDGPDIESGWHNFSALNIPSHHPARAMMDTFYLGSGGVLRTHTSPVQIRTMLEWAKAEGLSTSPSPIRIIVPGRVFRSDYDATHSPNFHQCEGLVIGEGIHLGHLKGCLRDFLGAYFGVPDLPVRLRSSYFPFTEPSMEVDIAWNRKTGEIGGGTDWLEIGGSGMVHANVLANCGIDPRRFQGFAFGVGLERITMLKHGMPDLRLFFESDVRWLRHYGFAALTPASLHEGI